MSPQDRRLYAETIPDGTFGGRRPKPDVTTPELAAQRRAVLEDAARRRGPEKNRRHLRAVPAPAAASGSGPARTPEAAA